MTREQVATVIRFKLEFPPDLNIGNGLEDAVTRYTEAFCKNRRCVETDVERRALDALRGRLSKDALDHLWGLVNEEWHPSEDANTLADILEAHRTLIAERGTP